MPRHSPRFIFLKSAFDFGSSSQQQLRHPPIVFTAQYSMSAISVSGAESPYNSPVSSMVGMQTRQRQARVQPLWQGDCSVGICAERSFDGMYIRQLCMPSQNNVLLKVVAGQNWDVPFFCHNSILAGT